MASLERCSSHRGREYDGLPRFAISKRERSQIVREIYDCDCSDLVTDWDDCLEDVIKFKVIVACEGVMPRLCYLCLHELCAAQVEFCVDCVLVFHNYLLFCIG